MIRAAVLRTGWFALLWWALAGGVGGHPLLALASVGAAAAASLALVPPGAARWRARAMPGFAAFFLRESLLAGIDVARRALAPRPPLRPGFVDFRSTLPAGPARVFLIGVINLLPGTLSSELRRDLIRVHVLDLGLPHEARLREVEARVAALFPG